MKTNRFSVLALAAAMLPLWACERDEPVAPADVGGGGSPAVEEPTPTPEPEPNPEPDPNPEPEPEPIPEPDPMVVSMAGTMWRCEVHFFWLPEKSYTIDYWTFETDSTVTWLVEDYYSGIFWRDSTFNLTYWFDSDSLVGEIYEPSKAWFRFVYDTAADELLQYRVGSNGKWILQAARFYRVY